MTIVDSVMIQPIQYNLSKHSRNNKETLGQVISILWFRTFSKWIFHTIVHCGKLHVLLTANSLTEKWELITLVVRGTQHVVCWVLPKKLKSMIPKTHSFELLLSSMNHTKSKKEKYAGLQHGSLRNDELVSLVVKHAWTFSNVFCWGLQFKHFISTKLDFIVWFETITLSQKVIEMITDTDLETRRLFSTISTQPTKTSLTTQDNA